MPGSHRDLLLSLRDYSEAEGLEAFLDRYDFRDATPRQIYSLGLGRMPESARVAAAPAGYSPRQHLAEMLRCPEFQSELILRVARAFPEKRRLMFVHVPKCAGTDLAAYLMRDFAHLAQRDQDPVHVPTAELPGRLQALMTQLSERDELVIMGHIGLNWLMAERLVRYDDVVFSVVRDPVDMAISKANYVLTLLLGRDRHPPLFIQTWMDLLGLSDFPRELDAETARREAIRLLYDPKVVPHDNLCRFLGRDDVESTLDLCAGSNIELTTVSRYPQWLRERWGIASDTRANESRKFLRREDLSAADLDHLHGITQKDRVLYQHIESRLAASGRASIFGGAL